MLTQHAHNRAEIALLKKIVAMKAGDPTEKFEKGVTRMMMKEYDRVAEAAVRAAVDAGGRTKASRVTRAEKALESAFKGFGSGLAPEFGEMLWIFYRDHVTSFIEKHALEVQKASRKPGLEIDFNLVDEDAVAVTEKLTVQSAGRYFPEQMAPKTSAVIRRVVLEQGLGIREASVVLDAELRAALGIDFSAVVPTQFRSNPQNYFETLAINASTQATGVGRMIAMNDAGVEKFRIIAVLDRATSAICRKLDGQEFAVSNGMAAVDKFLKVDSLDELESFMGFSKTDSAPKWATEGKGFPPFHHRCRTTVVPVF